MAMAEVAPRTRVDLGNESVLFMSGHALPECRVKSGVDEARKLLPLGIESLKLRGFHACILCRIHGATVFECDGSEFVEKSEGGLTTHGKVERERDAGTWKGHHARRREITEDLDDSEEGCQARASDGA